MLIRALGIALALLTLAVFGTLVVYVLGDDEYLGELNVSLGEPGRRS